MSELDLSSRLLNLLNSTFARRSLTRSRIARGRWWECEPDEHRLHNYKLRRETLQPSAQEIAECDNLGPAFLALSAQRLRAVAYIEIHHPKKGTLQACGFLIGGGLFITNHHVISSLEDALHAVIFFDRELDRNRRPLNTTAFKLDPALFFITSPTQKLDYTVIALGERVSGNATLAELGCCPLSPALDKHILGMNLNIVQFPFAQFKQVTTRNNLLTYRTTNTLVYETETRIGSSGSPIFNDMWEVVALHQCSEPCMANTDILDSVNQYDDEGFPIFANEGIRISLIHESLAQLLPSLKSTQYSMLEVAINTYRNTALESMELSIPKASSSNALSISSAAFLPHTKSFPSHAFISQQTMDESGQIRITVPLEIQFLVDNKDFSGISLLGVLNQEPEIKS